MPPAPAALAVSACGSENAPLTRCPVAFVLGMTLPLLVLVAFLPGASASEQQTYVGGLGRVHQLATPLAGAVFVLAGLYDTFVYWLL